MRVSHFKLWRPAILQPVDPGKVILPLWKALSPRNWNLGWKLEYLGSERPQTKFSEGGAFLVNWAVAPPGWCHTQFLYKFWKLCVRAFKWYLICGISSMGRWSKQQNCQEHFTAVSFVLSSTVPSVREALIEFRADMIPGLIPSCNLNCNWWIRQTLRLSKKSLFNYKKSHIETKATNSE